MPVELLEKVYPIIGLRVYPGIGLVINRKSMLQGLQKRGDRKAIKELSRRSLYKMILRVRSNSEIVWKSMLTLTYSEQSPSSGKAIKKNLNYALKYISRNYSERLMYFWFMEYQHRGAPHYHVIMDFMPSDSQIVQFAEYWVNLQGLQNFQYSRLRDKKMLHLKQSAMDFSLHKNQYGHYDIWQPVREEGGAIRYALKYASKIEQKIPPFWFDNPGRFWGTNLPEVGGIEVDSCVEDIRGYLGRLGHPIAKWEYLPKIILYRTNP